jgi:hypothetical protein
VGFIPQEQASVQFDAFGTMIFRAEKSVMRNTNLRSLQLRVEKKPLRTAETHLWNMERAKL